MPVKISSEYLGNLRVKNTHGPSGSIIETDAPLDNLGKGEKFSPTDLLVTSLASCVITTMAIIAQKENFDIGKVKCNAEKHMSEDKPRRVAKIVLDFELDSSLTQEQRSRLESIASNCPVHHSLLPSIETKISFTYIN